MSRFLSSLFRAGPTLLRAGHPLLRAKAQPIAATQLNSAEVKRVVADMSQVFKTSRTPVVGLAAPQIGQSLRLVAIELTHKPFLAQRKLEARPLTFLVNPKVTLLSPPRTASAPTASTPDWPIEYESCESVPGYSALVRRANAVMLEATTLDGTPIREKHSGYMARVLQNVTDMLDGVLIMDRMVPKSLRHDIYIDQYDMVVR
ncbi:hypothetical protein CXG81DRAFT_11043 [Caulochytrium protostelioides]|uniref:Peptide deformylase n=1 Tax=Caulochytrium protostelioides TaxID=1555241 RepID=A0A4P9X1L4_9FUNG|nr:peptide deformylase [Caulochytrium protostelioides]RKP02192.1 hypothetical protein CXG81DRAFT_11043 [Caulochytrium protostelioides]|eukprot:RKP02192.1 hypothetical protein CXG81DRAFT_11043 [Caulochytrium protostelioides]